MAISYRIYGNDGRGGLIDYATPIAIIPAASVEVAGSFTTDPLLASSDNLFAVRAFDDVTGIEEANTDARVRIIIDAEGRDVTNCPTAVVGLATRWGIGEVCLVSWCYSVAGQGGVPTKFDVTATPAASAPNIGSINPLAREVLFNPGTPGFECRLNGLSTSMDWVIQVRAVGVLDTLVGPPTFSNLSKQSGLLAAVDALMATPSA